MVNCCYEHIERIGSGSANVYLYSTPNSGVYTQATLLPRTSKAVSNLYQLILLSDCIMNNFDTNGCCETLSIGNPGETSQVEKSLVRMLRQMYCTNVSAHESIETSKY